MQNMNWILFIPYVIGTVLGSQLGVAISMRIEKKLNASTDQHLNQLVKQKNIRKQN